MIIARQGQLYTPWCMIRTTVWPMNQNNSYPSLKSEHSNKFALPCLKLKVQHQGFCFPLCTKWLKLTTNYFRCRVWFCLKNANFSKVSSIVHMFLDFCLLACTVEFWNDNIAPTTMPGQKVPSGPHPSASHYVHHYYKRN